MDQQSSKNPRRDFVEKVGPHYLQTLVSQIDDLQARLKVTVQRMAQFENDLQFSEEQRDRLQLEKRNLEDQLLIWKEKERLWLERSERARAQEDLAVAKESEIQTLRAENLRYIKYHEKIKTQIKPYIRQLKDYSKMLLSEIQDLKRELLNRDYSLKKTIERQTHLEQTLDELHAQQKQQIHELESFHIRQNEALQREVQNLRQSRDLLFQRSNHLDQSLERQDQLENQCIALRRQLESEQRKFIDETEGLRSSLQMARNDILKKNLQIESAAQLDLEQRRIILQLQDQLASQTNSATELTQTLSTGVPQSVDL